VANTLAKIMGWAFFGLQLANSVLAQGGPHGVSAILQAVGGAVAAVGIHASAQSTPSK
jgi:hypothetical protein